MFKKHCDNCQSKELCLEDGKCYREEIDNELREDVVDVSDVIDIDDQLTEFGVFNIIKTNRTENNEM